MRSLRALLAVVSVAGVAACGTPATQQEEHSERDVAQRDSGDEAVELASGLDNPTALATMGDDVFYADANAVVKTAAAASQPTVATRLPAVVTALTASGDTLFIATTDGVYRLRGGALERLSRDASAVHLQVVAGTLYYWRRGVHTLPADAEGTRVEPADEKLSGRNPLAGTYTVGEEVGGLTTMTRVVDVTALAVDETHAYFVLDGHIWRRAHTREGQDEAWAPVADGHVDMVVDDTHLYWGDPHLRAVLRRPKSGGDVELVATSFGVGSRLTQRGGALFLAAIDSSVHRIDKASLASVRLMPMIAGMGTDKIGIALGNSHVFLAVHRWSTSGNAPIAINDPSAGPVQIEMRGKVVAIPRPLEGKAADAPTQHRGLGAAFSVDALRKALPAPTEPAAPPPPPKADALPLTEPDPGAYLPALSRAVDGANIKVGAWTNHGFIGARESDNTTTVLHWKALDADPKVRWSAATTPLAMDASPDRKRAALCTYGGHLVVIAANTGKARAVELDGALGSSCPIWSPDSRSFAITESGVVGIHSVNLRGVRYLKGLPSQSAAVVWDDQGLLIYEWDDGDPDGMEWVGALRTRARGKPTRLAPEQTWFTTPDGTLRVRAESGNVLVKPVNGKANAAPRTIEHGKLAFGTGGFLAPDRPSWAGPHHLFANGHVIDLATGDQRPVRTNRWADVLAFSPDGKTVVIAADGELWFGPAHDAR